MRYQPVPLTGDPVFAESDVLSLTTSDTGEAVVVAAAGDFGACDVWFHGPDTWIATSHTLTVRLYARQAGARVMVGQAILRDVLHTEDQSSSTSAWVFSARGIESQGFEVTCQRSSGGVNLSGGQFFLRAKGSAVEPALLGTGGLPGLRAVTVSNVVQVQPSGPVTVTQTQPSSLVATVVQSTASQLQATAAQGAAAAASGKWPVYLTDGTVALATTTAPLHVARIRDGAATFAAATGLNGTGTAVALKSLAYLWHPNTSARRIEIRRIAVSYLAAAGTGPVVFRALRISGVAGTPGGTTLTATALDLSDTTTLTIQSGATSAPTRPGASQGDLFAIAAASTAAGFFEWRATEPGKALVLRPSMAEGLEVLADVKGTLSPQMQAIVSFEWVES